MHEEYMKIAIKEAHKAKKKQEMPVGCVIVYNRKIIGKGYNKKEKSNDPTMHAEINAIKKACKKLKDWRLSECTLYVTMEPCNMCMGAIIESRIKNVVCGVVNVKTHETNKALTKQEKIEMKTGICEEEINKQLKTFFKSIRNR